ncbi:hypothetical protein [Streptomyces acidiscabies]|uniref:hypothetical protein n=1 Tax=Streptomyces acidiscabies TaxID=42234 RepID=UPI0009522F9E|nr:hypothetical protein [Streptomyces acidiscabies]
MFVLALAGGSLLVTTSPDAHASAASVPLARSSGNKCGHALIFYDAIGESGGTYHITYSGDFYWSSLDLGCGDWRDPYAPVLQWKGKRWGVSFDWEDAPNGYDDDHEIEPVSGSGYLDVRFRVCNWNTDTGYVGTCGPS